MRTTRKFSLFVIGVAAGLLAIGIQAAAGAAGFTLLELPLVDATEARLLLPEGWAFFTRNPREPWLHFYTFDEGQHEYVEITAPPLADVRNAFGLRRGTRRQGVESGLVMAALSEDSWTPCSLPEIKRCLSETKPVLTMENPSPMPSLCGEIGVVSYSAVPFAWVRDTPHEALRNFAVPTRFAKVVLSCR